MERLKSRATAPTDERRVESCVRASENSKEGVVAISICGSSISGWISPEMFSRQEVKNSLIFPLAISRFGASLTKYSSSMPNLKSQLISRPLFLF